MSNADTKTIALVSVASSVRPRESIARALELLMQRVVVTDVSTFYRTRAPGSSDEPDFFVGALALQTDLPPRALALEVLQAVETELGAVRGDEPRGPRTVELDLVLYGDETLDEPDLQLPAEGIDRPRVGVPLAELAPGVVVPGSDRTLEVMAAAMDRRYLLPAMVLTRFVRARWTG